MQIDFDDSSHSYKINDIPVPGCTTITSLLPKKWLAPWASKMNTEYVIKEILKLTKTPELLTLEYAKKIVLLGKNAWRRKSEEAANSGTIAHEWIDIYIKNKINNTHIPNPLPVDLHAMNSIRLFMEWNHKEQPEWICSEVVVGSEKYMVGGKFDWIARLKEYGKTLGDNKTSNAIKDEFYIQVNGGYRMMYDEMNPNDKIDNSLILWIPKTGDEFEARIVPTKYDSDREIFLALLGLYKAIKARQMSYKEVEYL